MKPGKKTNKQKSGWFLRLMCFKYEYCFKIEEDINEMLFYFAENV